ncbi:MAG: DUF6754 domain-containing protein [Candidatus Zixiibacteriota bacterium]
MNCPPIPGSVTSMFQLHTVLAATQSTTWIDVDKLPTLIAALIAIAVVLFTTYHRASREKFRVREIPGLKAVEEAIGRATEMARPVLYTPGWGGDIQRPTTIASMNFLSHVAAKTAQYDCPLVFPTHDPVIMAVAQEVVRESYAGAGYPDRFRAEDISYVTSSQFGYAAAVDGMISRLKPASIFLLGTFEAESLILAETGNSVGAIQIAGTDSTIQLAFFIVACDYTLIGEELFAASGYLSCDQSILASVRAQDMLKVLIAAFLVIAVIWSTVSILSGGDGADWWSF